jgi:ATP-dependent Lhr-like helicase
MITKQVIDWLKKNNIQELTSVQKKAIPAIKKGINVLITAPTGYGKTLAVIIPLFEKLVEEEAEGLNILYVAPTKSLNRDIFKRVFKFAEHLGLTISVRHGDTTGYQRSKQVKNPPNILVTTPESLQSMLISKRMRHNLESLKHVVVDEIHELVSSKRGVQLTLGLERLNLISDFSRIGISATISDMLEVGRFLCGGRKCELVQVSEPKESKIVVLKPKNSEKGKLLADKIGISNKLASAMLKIKKDVEDSTRTIVFVNTRQQAEVLSFAMRKAFPEISIGLHHSSLSKKQRVLMENKLRDGELKALISTSSMELGIDVGSVDLVVQFMSPRQVNKLVQRVGRSGHAYYKKSHGRVYTLNDDDYLESQAIVELMKEGYLEKPVIPFNTMDVLAHQVIGFVRDNNKISVEELLEAVNKSYCFNLSMQEFEEFLKFLEELNYLSLLGEGVVLKGKSFYYYFENVSTIPDIKNYKIVNVETNSRIGSLHESFVLNYCNPGATIIIRGEPWDVLEIQDDVINVGRARSFSGAVPSWTGELIPVSRRVAMRVGELRRSYYDEDTPDSNTFFVEKFENNIIFHSCQGSKVNNTIGTFLSSILSARMGTSVGLRTDPYRVVLTLPYSATLDFFKQSIKRIKPNMIGEIVKLSAKNTTLFHTRFFNVGQRFGIIKKGAEYIGSKMQKIVEYYSETPIFTETLNEMLREKMDLSTTMDLFKRLRVNYSKKGKVTRVGFLGVNFGGFGGVFRSAESYEEIYAIVKDRLLNKVFNYECTNCGHRIGEFSVKSFPFEKCPKCTARTIGFTPRGRDKDEALLDETSNLFLVYGNKAAFVLAAYGVGVLTGKRLLRNMTSEKELLKSIIEEEKRFVRTRRYWK